MSIIFALSTQINLLSIYKYNIYNKNNIKKIKNKHMFDKDVI